MLISDNSANDLRYVIVLAAALKLGYVPLFTSPRNSLEGQESLIQKTKCEVFLTTAESKSQVDKIQQAIPKLKVFQAPTSQELLDSSQSAPYYAGRQSRDGNAHSLILHTSGSTGKKVLMPTP